MRIRRYIQGHRRGRDANRLERQAMRDPFLADALDGFDRVKEDPIPHIKLLRQKIRSRNQRRLDIFKYGGIAASLLFILGFGFYFGFHKNSISEQAMADLPVSEEIEIYEEMEIKREEPAVPTAMAEATLQSRSQNQEETLSLEEEQSVSQVLRSTVATAAEPVDGYEAYLKYLEEKITLPTDSCKDIKGRVIVSFTVNEWGRPTDIKIEKSLCPSADREAIRLVKEGPDWKPTGATGQIVIRVR